MSTARVDVDVALVQTPEAVHHGKKLIPGESGNDVDAQFVGRRLVVDALV
jgi:hypothetical protein